MSRKKRNGHWRTELILFTSDNSISCLRSIFTLKHNPHNELYITKTQHFYAHTQHTLWSVSILSHTQQYRCNVLLLRNSKHWFMQEISHKNSTTEVRLKLLIANLRKRAFSRQKHKFILKLLWLLTLCTHCTIFKMIDGINPLECKGNCSAISNNMKLVHWPLIGGLLHLVQQGGIWVGQQPAKTPPRSINCNSPSINGQCTNHHIAVQWSVGLRFSCAR